VVETFACYMFGLWLVGYAICVRLFVMLVLVVGLFGFVWVC